MQLEVYIKIINFRLASFKKDRNKIKAVFNINLPMNSCTQYFHITANKRT